MAAPEKFMRVRWREQLSGRARATLLTKYRAFSALAAMAGLMNDNISAWDDDAYRRANFVDPKTLVLPPHSDRAAIASTECDVVSGWVCICGVFLWLASDNER